MAEHTFTDSLLQFDDNWGKTTAQVIKNPEHYCAIENKKNSVQSNKECHAETKENSIDSGKEHPFNAKSSLRQDIAIENNSVKNQDLERPCAKFDNTSIKIHNISSLPDFYGITVDDIKYIDESAKSSLCPSLAGATQPSPQLSSQKQRFSVPVERECASVLEERYCQAFLAPKNDLLLGKKHRHYSGQPIASVHHILPKKIKQERCASSPLPSVLDRKKHKDVSYHHCSQTDFYTYIPTTENLDGHGVFPEHDFRYYFQHPYTRLFISYFVIFCNFLVFAEDPVSHSHTESVIPVVGNVFSFVATKYPPQWNWCVLKVLFWVIAIIAGMFSGKYVIHHVLLSRIFRLKMFRDEQGTWMIMFLTSLLFIYMFSSVYNFFLLSGHPNGEKYRINSYMGITNATFMKCAACGTWIGDFVTAWMVTDMMLQDNLYPEWAKPYRTLWRSHGKIRIAIFWTGSISMTALVVTLIVSDWISWDYLNKDFVATTELSRAFLASFILVMDLLIVMQDWDFPHFVCDLDIKLPGLHVSSFKFNLFKKYVHVPDVDIHVTGKWFNYSIIVFVMILDLNMWKNQIFYVPIDYGQYTGPDHKVFSISNPATIAAGNASLWTYDYRSLRINVSTNQTYLEDDISMNSRYLGYPLSVKSMAFMPSLIGFAMFGILTYMYGRFPPQTERLVTGRTRNPKRQIPRSSWRRERGTQCTHYVLSKKSPLSYEKRHEKQLKELVVSWDENSCPLKSCEKPL